MYCFRSGEALGRSVVGDDEQEERGRRSGVK